MRRGVSFEEVGEYLQLFDNNPIEAVNAIREYVVEFQAVNTYHPKAVTPLDARVLISVSSLTKSYKKGGQKIDVLRGITFDIREGELVALTGPSGSGKSTLLQIIGGLDKPSAGNVVIDGHNLSAMRDRQLSKFRNEVIGFVFQFFYLQPFLRLSRNIELPSMPKRTSRAQRRLRAKQLADAVGLSEFLTHFPKELSGGQIQRAAIARALFNNPKIILADEPTGNLDRKNSDAIMALLEKIRKEFGTTIVIVTHDPSIAGRADREISIRDGATV